MNKQNNSIPYSRRRFSNLAASNTNPNDLLQSQQSGMSAKKTLTLQVNDRAMGNISYSIVSVPSSSGSYKEQNKEEAFKDRFSTVTSVALSVGTVVTVVATPSSSRYVLDHFEDASGERLPSNTGLINVTMNNSRTVRAVFREAVTHTQVELRVNWNKSMGDVVCVPALSNAGTVVVDLGKTVTLTAIPHSGHVLREWNGTWVAGKEQPKHNLTISEQILSDRTINAVFAVADVPPENETPPDPLDPDPAVGPNDNGGGDPSDPLAPEFPENPDPLGPEAPGNDSGGNGGYNPEMPSGKTGDTLSRVKAFVRQWWWALAIVAYVIYKEREGGKK